MSEPLLSARARLQRGFILRCPFCGTLGSIQVMLDDLGGSSEVPPPFSCTRCRGEFAGADATNTYPASGKGGQDWRAALAWLDTAPAIN